MVKRLNFAGAWQQSQQEGAEDLPGQQPGICCLWPWGFMSMQGENAKVRAEQGCTSVPTHLSLHPAEIMPCLETTNPQATKLVAPTATLPPAPRSPRGQQGPRHSPAPRETPKAGTSYQPLLAAARLGVRGQGEEEK